MDQIIGDTEVSQVAPSRATKQDTTEKDHHSDDISSDEAEANDQSEESADEELPIAKSTRSHLREAEWERKHGRIEVALPRRRRSFFIPGPDASE